MLNYQNTRQRNLMMEGLNFGGMPIGFGLIAWIFLLIIGLLVVLFTGNAGLDNLQQIHGKAGAKPYHSIPGRGQPRIIIPITPDKVWLLENYAYKAMTLENLRKEIGSGDSLSAFINVENAEKIKTGIGSSMLQITLLSKGNAVLISKKMLKFQAGYSKRIGWLIVGFAFCILPYFFISLPKIPFWVVGTLFTIAFVVLLLFRN